MSQMQKMIRIILLPCLLVVTLLLPAQSVIEKLYVNMPDALNPVLNKQARLELLEYYKAGQGDSVLNRFGKKSYLLSMDTLHNHLMVRNTQSSTFDMKVLSLDDKRKVVGIIRTVCAPVCQSVVEFYDTAWNFVPLRFTMPKAIEWMNKNTNAEHVDLAWIDNLLETSFVSLAFSSENEAIVAKNNSIEFLSEADRKVVVPMFTDKSVTFWLVNRIWVREP